MLVLKMIGIWLLMVLAAILNGSFREFFLNKYMSETISLPLSAVTLSIFIFLIVNVFIVYFKNKTALTYIKMGLFWVSLTLIFEYSFGFSQGLTFYEISHVFNVLDGNLFSLVLLVTFFSAIITALSKGFVVKNT
ncbi:hypothetical protein [Vibrio metschnikovii]|uniref:hypothetical protein n=1 Tax=Vibrio metschnikovii TaxID=28172 RepID=UPI001C301FCD|nr:hypothetical protein [Vibrio metschnikovii]